MIGKTISHYQITKKLGEGGMGVVFRAHDENLDRDVAIKVLPDEFAKDPDRLSRFEREAKALAKLSHPNIMEIFDFGREGAVTYAVSELLDGETLRERLKSTRLSWRQAAEIGAALADGLAAAHQAGIVHRDLKPSNIFLTSDGRVKVLDFGLARTIDGPMTGGAFAPTISSYTDPGSVLGTVGYMSPEQVRGEPADHRSDIFSLGCVLFEMVAGRRAFVRDTTPETMTAILREEPSGLPTITPDCSPVFSNAIRRCLEKRPDARFQSGRDLAFVLRSVARDESGPLAITPSDEMTILVLPLVNLSADLENEYFSDGLTEEIIADLAGVRSLRVISRTSAMRLKGTDKDIRMISKELNTQYILEGSVRKAGTALRITAQLIDATNDTHLWAEKYAGSIEDVFDIQEKVSRSIVDALQLELNPEESRKIAERPIDNVVAYECYLRARREMYTFTEQGCFRAQRELENGLAIVGENAMLYFGLGEVHLQFHEFGIKADEATLKKAEDYAEQGLKLDPHSPHSHYLLGMIERFRGSVLDGIRHLERALVMDPDSPNVLMWLSFCYALEAGRNSAALQLANRLLEIDPLSPTTYFTLGMVHWLGGRLDQAQSSFKKNAMMEPEADIPRGWCAVIDLWENRYSQAFEIFDEIIQQEKSDQMHIWLSELLLFTKYAVENRNKEALASLSEDVKRYLWNDPDLPWLVIGMYSVMDDKEEALRWLEHAIDRGWINYPLFAEQDPFFQNIRGEEGFKKLMDRIKPEWERFEVRASLDDNP